MIADFIEFIRDATPEEVDEFVIPTWMSSYHASHSAGILSNSDLDSPCPACGVGVQYDYRSVMRVTLRAVMKRPGVSVIVAGNHAEPPPNDLFGYLVHERNPNVVVYAGGRPRVSTGDLPLVHYCYVKKTFRESGAAKVLFKHAGIDYKQPFMYSCKTPTVSKLEKLVARQAVWAPQSIRFAKGETTT